MRLGDRLDRLLPLAQPSLGGPHREIDRALAGSTAEDSEETTDQRKARWVAELKALIRSLESRDHQPSRPLIADRRTAPDTPRTAAEIADALGATREETPFGEVCVIRRRYPLDACHGTMRLGDAALLCDWHRRGGLPSLGRDFVRDAVFFDLETTGLSHGAGTMAFLVGIGRFADDTFCLDQFFLDDPANEQAMLHLVSEYFAAAPPLISYNGKSFDAHILHNRLQLQRIALNVGLPDSAERHLDLLHLSRRCFRGLYADLKLQTLERQQLGVARREDDIPGALIPTYYFDFLDGGSLEPLRRIIEHNRLDVLSMVSLVGRLRELLETPETPRPWQIHHNLARWWHHLGEIPAAMDAFWRADRGMPYFDVDPRLYEDGLKTCLQHSDTSELVNWLQRWRIVCPDDPLVHIRLSMWFEHSERNFAQAMSYAKLAQTHCDSSLLAADLCHRIARLERRLEREAPR